MIVKLIIRLLPWILVVLLSAVIVGYVYLTNWGGPATQSSATIVLDKVETLGKLELVRYNMKEIIELHEDKFKLDWIRAFSSDIVLITQGEVVGCIDLMQLRAEDFTDRGDTLVITLPEPEICYYKLNMENTKIYSLKTFFYHENKEFIQRAYRLAESEVRQAAIDGGILEQTRINARLVLKPLMTEVAGRPVILRFRSDGRIPGSGIERN